MSRNQESKVGYISFFYSLFSSPSPKEAEKAAIVEDLKIEITQLAKITNEFSRIFKYYDQITSTIVRTNDPISASPDIKALFSFCQNMAQTFLEANTGLHDLTLALIDIFDTDVPCSLSFEEKCIAVMAVAETADRILKSLVALPVEADSSDSLVIGNSLSLLTQTINNIRSLAAQGQSLCDKPVTLTPEPFKPFTGTKFSL